MEMASYMAGEPWSDHPKCTYPALAALARDINDYTSDEHRHRLAPLIPSVIGLTSDDPSLETDIALRNGQNTMSVINRYGVRNFWVLSSGGHDWANWRRYLHQTAQIMFPDGRVK